jgi:HTH-type transcriptional regulator / antitoxin MqsA
MIMSDVCAACGEAGRVTIFAGESATVAHAGQETVVHDLAGRRCGACGEVVFDAESAARYAQAGDALVLAERQRLSRNIRRIRRKLGLTQAAAARLTGGGHNAFSRYERGEATPLPAVVNLLMLLDRHPELIRELD